LSFKTVFKIDFQMLHNHEGAREILEEALKEDKVK
jgi:hypothetical protein